MMRQPTQTLADLYTTDETAWLDATAELIRAGRFDAVDYPHLAEYLEDMAQRDRREVRSRLRTLLTHFLLYTFHKPTMERDEIAATLSEQDEFIDLLESGTLRSFAHDILANAYDRAVEIAAIETNAPFPTTCP